MFFKNHWILWQNARNLKYIKWFNTNLSKKIADSKIKTKELLSIKWVFVPETILIISKHEDIDLEIIKKLPVPFVIKPNSWFGWKGIIVIESKTWEEFISKSWKKYDIKSLRRHFLNILDWFFSLSGSRDKVLIEKKVELDKKVELLWKYWLPDIRVVVFNMVPVIAMMRIPTEKSDGKSNLHAWACWVGIDIWTGKLTYMTMYSKIIKSIPWIWDIRWMILPHWEEVLNLAVKTQKVTNIWYLWCDIVLDAEKWPLLMEINLRPWLEVQVANMAKLKDRLDKVEWVYVNSVEKWVRLWRDLFSWDIEDKIKDISWKNIIWDREYVLINYLWKTFKEVAKVKNHHLMSSLSYNFFTNILWITEENLIKNSIKLNIEILWEKKEVKFIVKKDLENSIILWLNSLKWFLYDPFKYKKWELPFWWNIDLKKNINIALNKNYDKIIKNIDYIFASVEKKLLILKHITPINLKKEEEIFVLNKWNYNPKFIYGENNLDFINLEKVISLVEIPDIPLWKIYERKKLEIINKINFLKAFYSWKTKLMQKYSELIYWWISNKNLEYARKILPEKKLVSSVNEEFLTFDEIKEFVDKINKIYDIKVSLKLSNQLARFSMKWSTLNIIPNFLVRKNEIRWILAHEIESHYLRKINWEKLPYFIFSTWTANYLEIDEWIAIYNQNKFINNSNAKYYSIFEKYFFTNYALTNSHSKLIKLMSDYYLENYKKVFYAINRIKRWFPSFAEEWAFMKDVVYLNGFVKVKDFLEWWWDIKELYIWKVSLEDLEEIKNSYFMKLDFENLKVPE